MNTVILAIKQLLETAKEAAGSPLADIRRVYYGDPVTVHENILPVIFVQPIRSDYVKRGTRYDQKEHTVELRLVYNAKSFFGEKNASSIDLSSSVWGAGEIVFSTVTDHGLAVGDAVVVSESTPGEYNGTYNVIGVGSNTDFTVTKTTDPSAIVVNGRATPATIDKIYGVADGIRKTELSTNQETVANSICGVIQKNDKLPYNNGTAIINAAAHSTVNGVDYAFQANQRPFPAVEVVTTVTATTIANR